MQSRKELKKHSKRNNLYLISITIIIIAAIIGGVMFHNQKVISKRREQTFASTHFNPNVTIYGIKVGKLTVKQATKKINQKAINAVYLKNKKLVFEKDANIKTIDQATVQNYFNKQHTDTPNKQNYTYASVALTEAEKKLKQLQNTSVVYHIAGKSYTLKAANLISKASYRNNKYQLINTQNLTSKLNKIDKEVQTLKKSYKFTVPSGNRVNGKTITIKNESYGWAIYIKKAAAAVKQAFINDSKTIDGSKYIYGEGYSTYAHGYNKSNNGIGKNYVVVSISNQELWVVRHNRVAVHLNDVVTGTLEGGKGNQTPKGVWYIMYKESPSILRGYNDDGSKYSSKVQYWMPFTLSGCGLHDASWRTDWSKTAYLTGGSHGCVNIRPAEIRSVWNNVLTNEAVIVY